MCHAWTGRFCDLVAKLPPDAAVAKCEDLRSAVQTPTVGYDEERFDGIDMVTVLDLRRGGVAGGNERTTSGRP